MAATVGWGTPGTCRTGPDLIDQAVLDGVVPRDRALRYLAYALLAPRRLPAAFRGNDFWDGTPVLERLRREVVTLPEGTLRSEIETLLAGACGSSASPLPNVSDTAHFHIEWGPIQAPLGIAEYEAGLEAAWTTLVDAFGWPQPPVLEANPPPGGRYHVRIDDLGMSGGYMSRDGAHAGPVGDNPASPWDDGDAEASCVVVNSQLAIAPPSPFAYVRTLTAHEFTHALQVGIGASGDELQLFLLEGVANLMADEVARDAQTWNDRAWPVFTRCMGNYTSDPYNYWVVWRAMTEPLGAAAPGGAEQVFEEFYRTVSMDGAYGLDALAAAFLSRGTTLAERYHDAAIALKFLHSCGGGYLPPHCLEDGPDWLVKRGPTAVHGRLSSVPSSTVSVIADHFALNWIELPVEAGRYDVVLTNFETMVGALRLSVVCETGTSLRIASGPAVAGPGETTAVRDFDSTGCTTVIAVVTNQGHQEDVPAGCVATAYEIGIEGPSTPIRLLAVRDTSQRHVDLSWTGGTPDFVVQASDDPVAFFDIATVTAPAYRHEDAVADPPTLRFYRVPE